MANPHVKLYALFMKALLPVFDIANQALQKDEPVIHVLHSILTDQLKDILMHFVLPKVMCENANALHKVPFAERVYQVEDSNLFVGADASDFIIEHKSQLDTKSFYESVRAFCVAAVAYMVEKFPYNDPVLINACVANISERQNANWDSLRYFVTRWKCLLPADMSIDQLQTEFIRWRVRTLPESVITARNDVAWGRMQQMKNGNGQPQYATLCSVMLGILVLFHSNADCERIFSFVTKTKTAFRPSMSTKTLSSLLVHKVSINAKGTTCFQQKHSRAFLATAKSATYQNLQDK